MCDTVDESLRILLEGDGQPPLIFGDLLDTLVTKFHPILASAAASPKLLGIAVLGRDWFTRVLALQKLAMESRVSFRTGAVDIGLGQL
ncbi:hypothetical protein MCOR25_004936 [Pyricularia grisea]|nr:hypothetical protein MCOR25_004936 [Pyricularia grisea]